MAKLSNSLALVLIVSAIAVSAWEPPKLPVGRRLQYYILHPQGDYVFGYDTGEGSYHSARSDVSNRAKGNFQYETKSHPGSSAYSYTSGYAIPQPEVETGEFATVDLKVKSEHKSPAHTSYESGQSDASYSFSYDAGDHSRAESSDAAGNVRGRFAFVAKDGVQRKVDYEAGAEKGFIAKGDHLPVPPVPVVPLAHETKYASHKPVVSSLFAKTDNTANADRSYSFSYDAGDHSRQESADAAGNVKGHFAFVADDGINRKVGYEAGSEKGFLAVGAHLPLQPEIPALTRASVVDSSRTLARPFVPAPGYTPVDGSYSFSYDAGDHSREESSDAAGNIKGKFSFTAKDGIFRKVDYEAGAEKGFVAKGEHIPSAHSGIELKKTISSTAPISGPTFTTSILPIPKPSTKTADIHSTSGPDGSYSFSYVTDDHVREESADSLGNVKGHFAFVATDGINRKVDYEAGAEKGFVAKGAHLPAAPEVAFSAPASSNRGTGSSISNPVDGSYSFAYDAGDHSREESADSAGNVKGHFAFIAKDGINREVEYEAGAEKGFIAKGDHIPRAESVELKKTVISHIPFPVVPTTYTALVAPQTSVKSAAVHSSAQGDGSYSFSYDADDHSRQESSDAAGNVKGHFAFLAQDGINRKVEYTAGAERGFEAKGAHLPVAPQSPATVQSFSFTPSSYQAVKPVIPISSSDTVESSPVDASYSFSYDAGDHSRQESADSAGNIRGHFSFIAKDGINRKVDYEAGAEKGFLARGDHIPTDANFNLKTTAASPPSVPVLSYAQPLAPSFLPEPISVTSSGPVDASYSFSYDAPDHSREEFADAAGNVNGRFSFVAKDGINRRVDYEAGAERGFLAKGDHLPVPSLVGGTDGLAYQYSYDTDTSRKTESSDPNGFVTGSFSYLGADGITRKVDYHAGGEEGFVPTGEHLHPAVTATARLPSSLSSSHSSSLRPFVSSVSSPGILSSPHIKSISQVTQSIGSPHYSVRTFLPHDSPTKFGYIYESRA